jgi:hypothetical protein
MHSTAIPVCACYHAQVQILLRRNVGIVSLRGKHDRKCVIARILMGFEVSTALAIMNAGFRDVTLCGSYYNRCFGATRHLHLQVENHTRTSIIVEEWCLLGCYAVWLL